MKHMDRHEGLVRRLLDRARTIAVVGASPRPERHSHMVFRYLRSLGYDAIPIRHDGREVDDLGSYPRLEDVPGQVDLAVVFRRPDSAPDVLAAAAAKHVEAVWLPPGVWTHEAEKQAMQHGVVLIKGRCIQEDHSHLSDPAGHPIRTGVWAGRRGKPYEDNRKRWTGTGYAERGGGGANAAGGRHSVLDEKKMVRGRPSPRRGPLKPNR